MSAHNPQLEEGYTRVAHTLLEAIAREPFGPKAKGVVLFVLRQTYGRPKSPKVSVIPMPEIAQAVATSLKSAREIVRYLVMAQVLVESKDERTGARLLGINKRHGEWTVRGSSKGRAARQRSLFDAPAATKEAGPDTCPDARPVGTQDRNGRVSTPERAGVDAGTGGCPVSTNPQSANTYGQSKTEDIKTSPSAAAAATVAPPDLAAAAAAIFEKTLEIDPPEARAAGGTLARHLEAAFERRVVEATAQEVAVGVKAQAKRSRVGLLRTVCADGERVRAIAARLARGLTTSVAVADPREDRVRAKLRELVRTNDRLTILAGPLVYGAEWKSTHCALWTEQRGGDRQYHRASLEQLVVAAIHGRADVEQAVADVVAVVAAPAPAAPRAGGAAVLGSADAILGQALGSGGPR